MRSLDFTLYPLRIMPYAAIRTPGGSRVAKVGVRQVDLKEAAEILGSTTEALRKRAKRGTLASETGDDGKMYVWVDDRVDGQVADNADRVDDRVDDGDSGHRDEL